MGFKKHFKLQQIPILQPQMQFPGWIIYWVFLSSLFIYSFIHLLVYLCIYLFLLLGHKRVFGIYFWLCAQRTMCRWEQTRPPIRQLFIVPIQLLKNSWRVWFFWVFVFGPPPAVPELWALLVSYRRLLPVLLQLIKRNGS